MSVREVQKDTEQKMQKTIESAKREFNEVRTGRAHPGLLEGLHVDYYGTLTMLKELASISIPDPKTIMIQPWDPSGIADIEKAINESKLGMMPNNDGRVIRLNVPALSEERRREMIKVVKEMAEKSRVSLRTIRREANDKLKKLLADKVVSEDDSFRSQEDIQKLTDKFIREIDQLLDEKSKHLMEV